jgi:hypothetical protein
LRSSGSYVRVVLPGGVDDEPGPQPPAVGEDHLGHAMLLVEDDLGRRGLGDGGAHLARMIEQEAIVLVAADVPRVARLVARTAPVPGDLPQLGELDRPGDAVSPPDERAAVLRDEARPGDLVVRAQIGEQPVDVRDEALADVVPGEARLLAHEHVGAGVVLLHQAGDRRSRRSAAHDEDIRVFALAHGCFVPPLAAWDWAEARAPGWV